MKKFLLVVFTSLLVSITYAQSSNLVVFTEGNERFSILLDGQLQNQTPATYVKAHNLTPKFYSLKLVFENRYLPSLTKKLVLDAGEETTVLLKKNKKGKYKLRYRGSAPFTREATQNTHSGGEHISTDVQTDGNAGNVSLGFNINVNESGNNVSVNFNGNVDDVSQNADFDAHHDEPKVPDNETYNRSPCYTPASSWDFESIKKSMQAENFDDTKLKLAKEIVQSKCLKSVQLTEILKMLTFENNRLELAKFAYPYIFDADNYYKVTDAFEFSSTKDELLEFIKK